MRRSLAVAVGLVAALFAAGCGNAATGTATPRVGAVVGDVAPPVSGTSLQGHHVDVAAWRGSVVVVVFWASWCEPCQAEQPALNTLAVQEQPHGVHFTGVSVDVDAAAARGYLSRYAVPYDSLIDDTARQTLTIAFDISGPPQTFIIDGRGRVANRIVGPVDATQLSADIEAARSAT